MVQNLQAADFSGHWEGQINTPGLALLVQIDLAEVNGSYQGKISLPQQKARDLPLSPLQISENHCKMSIQGIPGEPTFEGNLKDGVISGSFTQAGASFEFELSREIIVKLSARPQEPKPPFPYIEEKVVFPGESAKLAGTLSFQEGSSNRVGLILLPGSGAQDRNEEIFRHKPFLILAHELTQLGYVVLRYDDRGVGESKGKFRGSTSLNFAADAAKAFEFLKTRSEVNPEKIGFLGHSEGGLLAPIVASKHDDVAFLILMAGTGVDGKTILKLQRKLLNKVAGLPSEQYSMQETIHDYFTDSLLKGKSDSEIQSGLEPLVSKYHDFVVQNGLGKMTVKELLSTYMKAYSSPWMREFLFLDPADYLSKVTVPVLALNGSLDLQVDANQNLPAIKKALDQAGNKNYELAYLRNLNHLMQTAKTGSVQEYDEIEETLSESFLSRVKSWLIRNFPNTEQ